MERYAYIGSAGVAGNGGGGGAIGSLEYIQSGLPVPPTHLPANGRTVSKKNYPALFAKKSAFFGGKSVQAYVTTYWPGAGPNSQSNTRGRHGVVHDGKLILFGQTTDSSTGYAYTYDPYTGEKYSGNTGVSRWLSAVGCENNFAIYFTYVSGSPVGKVAIKENPDYLGAGSGYSAATEYTTLDAPGGANVINTLKPVFFKGLYVSGNLTSIRTSVGEGGWDIWTARTTASRTGDFIDILTDGSTIAAFTSSGEVYTSTDAITWTKAVTTGLPAATYNQAAYNGDGTFALINSITVAGSRVYLSSDLANWSAVSNIFGDTASVTPQSIHGGAGLFFALRMTIGTPNGNVVVMSTDGGLTWVPYLTSTEVVMRPRMVLVTDGGTLALFGSDMTELGNYGINFYNTGSVLPRAGGVLGAGSLHLPYVKVR